MLFVNALDDSALLKLQLTSSSNQTYYEPPPSFGVSTTSHILRSSYAPVPALATDPAHLLPQPHCPLKRADKCS